MMTYSSNSGKNLEAASKTGVRTYLRFGGTSTTFAHAIFIIISAAIIIFNFDFISAGFWGFGVIHTFTYKLSNNISFYFSESIIYNFQVIGPLIVLYGIQPI